MKRVAFWGESVMLGRVRKLFAESYPYMVMVHDEQYLPEIDALVCWKLPEGMIDRLPNLRLIHSVGAGCETIIRHPLPNRVSVCRVVDDAQIQGMIDYCTWAALYYYRELDKVIENSRHKVWEWPQQVPKNTYKIGIMGLGNMGCHVATSLSQSGFEVCGWARTSKQLKTVKSYAGNHELEAFLEGLDLVICLLPLTPETRGILSASFFEKMQPGSVIVNLGRGEHLVEEDLLTTLQEGHLRGALLDVFDNEPLEKNSPLWGAQEVLVTPHMASASSVEEITRQIHDNIIRMRSGEELLNRVDHERGY